MPATSTTSEPPFRDVALSLSGGGTRAIGFHLGTLGYLERSGILGSVRVLSTVSGGSLIGTVYALSLAEDISFQDIFVDLFEFLPNINIVEGLLDILNRDEPPVRSGRRDLATALAELYHEKFFRVYFKNPTFGSITHGTGRDSRQLEEIAFCATEFKTGIAFRFQKSDFDCRIGNGNVWIDDECADEMRLADIVSASSCVPGGFEPLELPSDFHWPEIHQWGPHEGQPFDPVELRCRQGSSPPAALALMDGGVYDNQGITSVLLSLARRRRESEDYLHHETGEYNEPQSWASWARSLLAQPASVDLFIISDTPVLKDTFYAGPTANQQRGSKFADWLRKRRLADLSLLSLLVAAVLIASSAFALFASLSRETADAVPGPGLSVGLGSYTLSVIGIIATLIPTAVAAAIGATVFLLRRELGVKASSMEAAMPKLPRPLRSYLMNIRLGDIWSMLSLRGKSLAALAADIYMHRIRQLGYGLAFSYESIGSKILANEIYSLVSPFEQTQPLQQECSAPSATTAVIASMSSTMPTKAWFDRISASDLPAGLRQTLSREELSALMTRADGKPRTDLDVLVACGQVTMCFNLMRFIRAKRRDAEDSGSGPAAAALDALLSQAVQDWNLLQANPFAFIDERLKTGRSPEHAEQIRRNAHQV